MPFGLKNAAQSFQRLMDGILRDVPYAFVYPDDILIASQYPQEHLQHLTAPQAYYYTSFCKWSDHKQGQVCVWY